MANGVRVQQKTIKGELVMGNRVRVQQNTTKGELRGNNIKVRVYQRTSATNEPKVIGGGRLRHDRTL